MDVTGDQTTKVWQLNIVAMAGCRAGPVRDRRKLGL